MTKILLIVDDDESLCNVTKDLLSHLDPSLDIRTTTSPLKALNLVTSMQIDFILSDFMMPEMNGLELLEAIRANGYSNPFVLLTGHPVEIIGPRARESGALACFQKSGDISTYFDILSLINA